MDPTKFPPEMLEAAGKLWYSTQCASGEKPSDSASSSAPSNMAGESGEKTVMPQPEPPTKAGDVRIVKSRETKEGKDGKEGRSASTRGSEKESVPEQRTPVVDDKQGGKKRTLVIPKKSGKDRREDVDKSKVGEHSGVRRPDENKDVIQPSGGHASTDVKTSKSKHPEADIIQAEIRDSEAK